MQAVSIQTVIIIVLFAVGYMFLLIRKAAYKQLDIYDLIMLSTVAIIPCGFVFFPEITSWISKVTGVVFPFVVMFGILFVILFFFIDRIITKLHRLESENRLIIQEVSLLRQTIEQQTDGHGSE